MFNSDIEMILNIPEDEYIKRLYKIFDVKPKKKLKLLKFPKKQPIDNHNQGD